jgi:hypothetical protein
MSSQQHLAIMIVEDNRADVHLLKEALHQAEMISPLSSLRMVRAPSAISTARPERKPDRSQTLRSWT